MEVPAGWYPDPTRPGRKRAWDGERWGDEVRDPDGVEYIESIAGPEPPPPLSGPARRSPAAATASAPAAAGAAPYPPTALGFAGLVAAAVGALLAASTYDVGIVRQEPPGVRPLEVSASTDVLLAGILGVASCIAGMTLSWRWRLAAAALVIGCGSGAGVALWQARTHEELVDGIDVSLTAAGVRLLVGVVLLLGGAVVALVGFRRPVSGPDPSLRPVEGKARMSLWTGIVGLVVGPLAAVAVGLALLARDDERASGGQIEAGGRATAGLVLGVVSLAITGLVVLLMGLLAQP